MSLHGTVLHKVEHQEIPTLHQWLQSYLPESWALHRITKLVLLGKWNGQSFYTLGWPEVRAVVTGQAEADHPCPAFYTAMNVRFLYALTDEDVDELINEVADFSKPFYLRGVPGRFLPLVEKLVKAKGFSTDTLTIRTVTTFHAEPGGIKLRPVPEKFKVRPVKTDSEIDYIAGTWNPFPFTRPDDYVRGLVARFPSVCVADQQDECVSFELGTEYGMGLLHTKDEYRRQGLAKVVISHLAEEYRKLNLSVYTSVMDGNEKAFRLHVSLGFKQLPGKFCLIAYNP